TTPILPDRQSVCFVVLYFYVLCRAKLLGVFTKIIFKVTLRDKSLCLFIEILKKPIQKIRPGHILAND
ncbi:MAG: hypothetical protein RBR40_14835, partial [Tenuifilaceae bacterium]|nr:hypothetical protein [Tenuifilaceae bacterium]